MFFALIPVKRILNLIELHYRIGFGINSVMFPFWMVSEAAKDAIDRVDIAERSSHAEHVAVPRQRPQQVMICIPVCPFRMMVVVKGDIFWDRCCKKEAKEESLPQEANRWRWLEGLWWRQQQLRQARHRTGACFGLVKCPGRTKEGQDMREASADKAWHGV